MGKVLNWREYERETSGVKKAEVLKIPFGSIFVREGFNPRDLNKLETKAKIQAINDACKGSLCPSDWLIFAL